MVILNYTFLQIFLWGLILSLIQQVSQYLSDHYFEFIFI